MKSIKKNRAGVTLIELIISIAIIGIIAVYFMPLFVMSSKTNSKSETTLDSTYLGKDAMEAAYKLRQEFDSYDLENKLKDELDEEDKAYTIIPDNEKPDMDGFWYEIDNKYLNIKLTKEDNLARVIVRIYKYKNRDQLEVQYESLYSWKGSGN